MLSLAVEQALRGVEGTFYIQLHCDGKNSATSQKLHVGSANCKSPGMHIGDIKLVSGKDLDCVGPCVHTSIL